jgi:hypothetical protein
MSPTSRGLASALALVLTTIAAGCARGAEPPPLAQAERAPVSRRPAAASTTTTTAASTATEVRRWTGDGTPAPRLRNRGNDHVAVFQSLERYRRWLEAHRPDPRLVPRVWVPKTAIATKFTRHLGELQARRLRWVDVGDRSVARVVSVAGGIVSLHVDEHTTGVRLLDEHDRVVDTARQGPVLRLIVLLQRDPRGRWRIASVTPRLDRATEVAL